MLPAPPASRFYRGVPVGLPSTWARSSPAARGKTADLSVVSLSEGLCGWAWGLNRLHVPPPQSGQGVATVPAGHQCGTPRHPSRPIRIAVGFGSTDQAVRALHLCQGGGNSEGGSMVAAGNGCATSHAEERKGDPAPHTQTQWSTQHQSEGFILTPGSASGGRSGVCVAPGRDHCLHSAVLSRVSLVSESGASPTHGDSYRMLFGGRGEPMDVG